MYPPNSRGLLSAGMATEMALKAFLVFHSGFKEEDLKSKFGHNLEKLLDAASSRAPTSEFCRLRGRLNFPPIGTRYEGIEWQGKHLWEGYKNAQFVASALMRHITGRNVRSILSSAF